MKKSGNKSTYSISGIPVLRAVLLLLFLGLTIGIALDIFQLQKHLTKAKSAVSQASAAVKFGDIERGKSELLQAKTELLLAKKYLEKSDITFLRNVPLVGNNVTAIGGITEASQHSILAAFELTDVYRQLDKTKKEWRKSGRIESRALATESSAHLDKASGELKAALAKEREEPDSFLLPQVAEAKTELDDTLATLCDGIVKGRSLCKALPNLLGENGRRDYFIAVQNNADLRATGGWIGIFGILVADHGSLEMEKFEDIHTLLATDSTAQGALAKNAIDPNAPVSWLNVNMSPDFPTSAARIQELYKKSTGRRVDGVIAVDPIALSYLLEGVGPVKVPGLGVEISQENAVRWTLSEEYQQFDSKAERKGALKFLAENVWSKVMKGEFSSMTGIAKGLQKSAGEKHLMAYMNDPAGETAIKEAGLGGEIGGTATDYLLVDVENCSTLGNKLDYYLKESVRYTAEIGQDGSANVTVNVSLKNEVPKKGLTEYVTGGAGSGAPVGTNETYVSVFAPKEARFLSASGGDKRGAIEKSQQSNRNVFSLRDRIPPGQGKNFTFSYRVEKAAHLNGDHWEYSLFIQKQPLVNDASYEAEVSFQGHRAADGDFATSGATARASGKLTTDTTLKANFD